VDGPVLLRIVPEGVVFGLGARWGVMHAWEVASAAFVELLAGVLGTGLWVEVSAGATGRVILEVRLALFLLPFWCFSS